MNTPYHWLTPALRSEIKSHFEPELGRQMSELEIEQMAEGLTEYMETLITWKMKYESPTARKQLSRS